LPPRRGAAQTAPGLPGAPGGPPGRRRPAGRHAHRAGGVGRLPRGRRPAAVPRGRPPARCAGDTARPLRGGDGAADDRRGVPLALNPARGAAENRPVTASFPVPRSEEHTSELQSREKLVCRLLLENKNINIAYYVK